MVSSLDPRSNGRGASPDRGNRCVLGQDTLPSQCLPPHTFINLILGGNPAMD